MVPQDKDFGVTGLDKQAFVRLELLLGVTAALLVLVFTED